MPLRRSPTRVTHLAQAAVDLFGGPGGDRTPPKEFKIFPFGVVETKKGHFLFDEEAARRVMSSYAQHDVDLSIDYDHHTLATGAGVKAIAAGWFNLDLRADGLYASNVRWTPEAERHLRAGEYRYFSPLFDAEAKTGRITDVINTALTNTPAMDGIEALVAASATTEEDPMDPELKKALERVATLEAENAALRGQAQTATVALSAVAGLPGTAGEADVKAEITSMVKFRREALSILGQPDQAKALGELAALKETAAEVVTLRGKVETAEATALSAEWGKYLDDLTVKGKDAKGELFLQPANRATAEKMAIDFGGGKLTAASIATAKGYVDTMLRPGKTEPTKENRVALAALSPERIAVATAFGRDVTKVQEFEANRLAQGQQ